MDGCGVQMISPLSGAAVSNGRLVYAPTVATPTVYGAGLAGLYGGSVVSGILNFKVGHSATKRAIIHRAIATCSSSPPARFTIGYA